MRTKLHSRSFVIFISFSRFSRVFSSLTLSLDDLFDELESLFTLLLRHFLVLYFTVLFFYFQDLL
jgi:hypothetical protein